MVALTSDVRKGRKYDQVVDGARAVFMENGFEGASVDEIARRAQVSKATLYSYFPDKRVLFMEVAKTECVRQADAALDAINMTETPEVVLKSACKSMMRFFFSDFGQAVFRIAVAESKRFPELGQQFYTNGPMVARGKLMKYLQEAVARGELVIEDLELAADQLPQLCQADLFDKLMFGIQDKVSEAEIQRVGDGAVDMFLARYAA
ncbi:MAG: TetR/AcrR family transcriptional regulator [Pseudomonadota bacterium]